MTPVGFIVTEWRRERPFRLEICRGSALAGAGACYSAHMSTSDVAGTVSPRERPAPDTEALQRLLHERFGFARFQPGQQQVIEALVQHGRALAVFPTGGGKSLCYQLPALAFEGVTLVVSPLIALMKDQIDWLTRHGIAAARLDSSLGTEELGKVNRALEEGSLRLLYVAPERFQNERFLQSLARLRIALFAIDEAHCISEWGHNFRPEYLKLAGIARDIQAERVLALTATATPSVARDICSAFDIPASAAVVTGFYRANLELVIEPIEASSTWSARMRTAGSPHVVAKPSTTPRTPSDQTPASAPRASPIARP